MFWYDKEEPHTTYMDIRHYYEELPTGHIINVNPDIVGDFTHIPFDDNQFDLIIFDPPHLKYAGDNSWLAKKYGKLPKDWQTLLHDGFTECRRVLKPTGSLIMKWNTDQIAASDLFKAIGSQPILGDKRAKTRWFIFLKK